MVATKFPFGAIDERLIALIQAHPNGRFYVIDNFGSHIEVEKDIYLQLKKKGVKELCK